jgi:hypothetical protein
VLGGYRLYALMRYIFSTTAEELPADFFDELVEDAAAAEIPIDLFLN